MASRCFLFANGAAELDRSGSELFLPILLED